MPAAHGPSHAFDRHPHRVFLALSLPVLLSLIAEPLTALVDTAFVSKLGAAPQAALGVGTTLLSGIYWIFNFLSVGVQSEVARHLGAGERERACESTALALSLALVFGLALGVVGWWIAPWAAERMGASPSSAAEAVTYLRLRLLAAPAVLVTATGFGALRGLQQMRVPMIIALVVNALNIGLDAWLIFGGGPIPALGIAGAAWASTISQWTGAGLALVAVGMELGLPRHLVFRGSGRLLHIGGDMFVRTGLLTLFLVLGTRVATRIGDEAGAAHHAIRQFWLFSALLLDAFAVSAQSLVGWYFGAERVSGARRVATLSCLWGFVTGVVLAIAMWLWQEPIATLLVPAEARHRFADPWVWATWAMPANALCFATDGLHWGSRDYRYLRNAMILATGAGVLLLWQIDVRAPTALVALWQITALWISIRTAAGILRIWPGFGRSPYRRPVT